MKIGHTSTPAADAATLARANTETGAAAQRAKTAQATDISTVKLSATAAQLLEHTGSAEFDAAKVARIKQSISDGTYKINPEAIADKLIANAQEVLAAAKR
jgi:negative regulator of flagellin synthesis FlgM